MFLSIYKHKKDDCLEESGPRGTAEGGGASRAARAGSHSVDRGPAVARQQPGAARSQAIADELELAPSTCLHILRVLIDEELVKIDPSAKRYSVGPGVLSLARSALKSDGFGDLVQPYQDDLAS